MPIGHGVVLRPSGIHLEPDPDRCVLRFFVPGREDVGPGDSRATPVIERILSLTDREVDEALADVIERFAARHRDLVGRFEAHADELSSRLPDDAQMSSARRLFIGACFSCETAIEGAAICNPSMVLHPEPGDDGSARFVMSVRGIGEGHRSTIGFRTGSVSAQGVVQLDPPGDRPDTAVAVAGAHRRTVLWARLAELDDDHENASFVLDLLPEVFDDGELEARLDALMADHATRRGVGETVGHFREVTRSSYRVVFPHDSALSERVLWPRSPAEHQGMEDARFVRFVDDDGSVRYLATYTAFDGLNIRQHLLETEDFITFDASPMAGTAAVGKGLALFPRRVGGRFMALSRSDRETNALTISDDLRCWSNAVTIQLPTQPWEILQLGNCGSPIETEQGWLVLTHGVGAMRTYSIGALLLDLHDPAKVLAMSDAPLLTPGLAGSAGYVPNVVYTCGALAHGDVLVLPHGIGDRTIAITTVSISELVGSLCPTGV